MTKTFGDEIWWISLEAVKTRRMLWPSGTICLYVFSTIMEKNQGSIAVISGVSYRSCKLHNANPMVLQAAGHGSTGFTAMTTSSVFDQLLITSRLISGFIPCFGRYETISVGGHPIVFTQIYHPPSSDSPGCSVSAMTKKSGWGQLEYRSGSVMANQCIFGQDSALQ